MYLCGHKNVLKCPYCANTHREILLTFTLLHRYLVFFPFQICCDMGMTNLLEVVVALYLVKVRYFCGRSKRELESLNTCLFLLTWPIYQTWSTTSHTTLSSQDCIISGHVTFFFCKSAFLDATYIFLFWFVCYWIYQILVFTGCFISACFFFCLKAVGEENTFSFRVTSISDSSFDKINHPLFRGHCYLWYWSGYSYYWSKWWS